MLQLFIVYVIANTHRNRLHADRIHQQKYAFMYSRWEASFFYWELIFLSRRTIFSVLGLLSDYPPLQAVIAQVVVGLATGLQLRCQPYMEDRLDTLDNMLLSAIVLLAMCATIFYGAEYGDVPQVVVSITEGLALFSLGVLFLAALVSCTLEMLARMRSVTRS